MQFRLIPVGHCLPPASAAVRLGGDGGAVAGPRWQGRCPAVSRRPPWRRRRWRPFGWKWWCGASRRGRWRSGWQPGASPCFRAATRRAPWDGGGASRRSGAGSHRPFPCAASGAAGRVGGGLTKLPSPVGAVQPSRSRPRLVPHLSLHDGTLPTVRDDFVVGGICPRDARRARPPMLSSSRDDAVGADSGGRCGSRQCSPRSPW